MAIRLLCASGTLMIQSGSTRDRVKITSQAREHLRRILGPEAVINQRGRNFYVHIDRDQLPGLLIDVFERYGT
jgi:hypothetical protein